MIESEFNEILSSYKIKAECQSIKNNNNYMFCDLVLKPGGKVKDILRYSDEISLAIKSYSKPTVNVIHDQGIVRIGFAKKREGIVDLFSLINDHKSEKLNCVLGSKIDGTPLKLNLEECPHLIVSGATGSGKSVLLHNIVANIVQNKSSKLILMDPKNIEFSHYKNKINDVHVKNTFSECLDTLKYLVDLMNYRYSLIERGVKEKTLPYIVVIIDEFADLIMQDEEKEFYNLLCKLSQKCRAAKMHIVIATQRPSVDVISGTIKANFPARIACRVASATDSRVVLDSKGAENLLGNGDALIKDNTRTLERFQVAFTSVEKNNARFKNK